MVMFMITALESDDDKASKNTSIFFEAVSINGHEGTVVVKNSLVTIIWAMNDRMFTIRGEMEKDTAVKMAEGFKYID